MKTLSGLDATFLYLETPETPMHVGSLHLYELPKGFRGSFHRAVQDHIAGRLHLAPIFTRRLAFMPFDMGHPMWVEADEVDLDFHIRKAPGAKLTVRQVEAAAAKLHAELIDRNHPLWQFTIFDNVAPPKGMAVEGRLVAFHSRIHHAALDGKGGTVLANAILDLTPVPREVAPADPSRRGRSGADLRIGEMIGAVFSNSLAQYAKLARTLPAAAGSIGGLARQSITRTKAPVQLAPRTIFNVGITARRSFATATLPFAQARAVAKAAGGSFNDVVLWVCATALREYLHAHGTVPRKPLVAAMPVSLREESNKELNNQASLSLVQLGTHLADPKARMQAILESTGKVKEALSGLKSVLPTDYPSLMAPWLVGGAGRLALKTYGSAGIAERLPALANVAISNVPGPQMPLYLAGARMLTFHPLSIILHGMALNITIQTYAGRVDFGLIADPAALPQLQQLASGLEKAFEQAVEVFGTEAPTAAAPATAAPAKPAPRKRAAKTKPPSPRKPAAKPQRKQAA
ncbi:wax ester/triacylglycerol synthase family O-acyltransferase [Ramlibacter humi]|uniref:diacylglycerol O-acyltransferase n=1 Tax=Ramlibacter humi TaxID=2530451 RepID=A0A4Z0CBQ9_9BURK|nr:wax ester/triacylglycerol synthase family O-acyltransferase [Ramlibacter humi]TFZ08454.1 wax ester/triacylglycerol synthase family O-acyltransferase [Ramlibacter humi]